MAWILDISGCLLEASPSVDPFNDGEDITHESRDTAGLMVDECTLNYAEEGHVKGHMKGECKRLCGG